ncbi:hypothetical protein FRZ61_47460 [Hypericibacter adhaerens]|uniref:Uncharacterized protein n=1 Tax=Hypericibacter adhaerens TaxID=2602016 RepID=A0A5J6N5W6_9PROT|nr:hypothetical protein FRZ61_47460 [Hypericibacter adhaerens]
MISVYLWGNVGVSIAALLTRAKLQRRLEQIRNKVKANLLLGSKSSLHTDGALTAPLSLTPPPPPSMFRPPSIQGDDPAPRGPARPRVSRTGAKSFWVTGPLALLG